jgi:hypothetical protein
VYVRASKAALLLALGVVAIGGGVAVTVAGAAKSKRVIIDVSCSIPVGSSSADCAGTWKMKGDLSDSGILRSAFSRDDGAGVTMRGELHGKKGQMSFTTGFLAVSQLSAGCPQVASWTFNNGTRSYAGYRGTNNSCTSSKISGGRFSRKDHIVVRLEKR